MLKFVCAALVYTVVTSSSAATQGSGAGSISGNERAATMCHRYPVERAAHRK